MTRRVPQLALHLLHGLAVHTPFELAAGAPEPHGTRIDLTLSRGQGPVVTPSGRILAEVDHGQGRRRHVLSADKDGTTVLTLTGTASVTFSADRTQAVLRVGAATQPALLPVLVAGPVMVTATLLAGHDLVHASATLLPELGGVVAFVGPAGAGKSSLARLVSGPGRPLLSDDALRIDVGATTGIPTVHRGTTGSRLRSRVDELAVADTTRAPAGDGRFILADSAPAPPTAALRLVALPRLTPAVSQPRVVAVPRAAAVPLLASAAALDGVRDRDLMRRQLVLAAALARSVPVVELWVPWDTSALSPGLADELRTLLVERCGVER